jgi:hypothetical protein
VSEREAKSRGKFVVVRGGKNKNLRPYRKAKLSRGEVSKVCWRAE